MMKVPALKCFNNEVLFKATRSFASQANTKYVNQAQSGKENFEKDYGKSHIPTTPFQKILLGIGSGIISIANPSRGDMVAVMGEVTGLKSFEYIRNKMLETEEGKRILDERPRISSGSVDLELLKSYPKGTLGKAYSDFLENYGYSPDLRNAVRFVDDVELAYVAQRYREIHDLLHTVFQMPTNMLGEVTVKWVEAIQTRMPMCFTGALFGSARLAPKFSRLYSTNVRIRVNEELDKQIQSQTLKPKNHPGVMHLKSIEIPNDIKRGILLLLENQNRKELIEMGEKLDRQLKGRHIPLESDVHNQKIQHIEEKIKAKFNVVSLEEADDKVLQKIREEVKKRGNFLLYNWRKMQYDKRKSLQYMVIRAPAEYAVLRRVFNEILLRDKDFKPSGIFDFGSGVGTVVWAAHELWGSTLSVYMCIDSSKYMNDLASSILISKENEEPIIKNIHYRQFLPMTPHPYNIVVSSFSLFEIGSCQERFKTLTVLWNNTTDYLVLIENGTNAGHQILEEAKNYILTISRKYNVDCHVFAPCPHDLYCPRLCAEGKRTPCNFSVSYFKLPITKMEHTTKTINFSFLILQKRKPPPMEERQSRIIRDVLKRHKHVACHLCTNKGELKTFFFTAVKNGKSTYKCMRYSHWGDITPPGSYMEIQGDSEELISDQSSDSNSDDEDDGDSDVDDVDDGNNGASDDSKSVTENNFKDEQDTRS